MSVVVVLKLELEGWRVGGAYASRDIVLEDVRGLSFDRWYEVSPWTGNSLVMWIREPVVSRSRRMT